MTAILHISGLLTDFVVKGVLEGLGKFMAFSWRTATWVIRPPFRSRLVFDQLLFIGVNSLPIVLLTAVFTGMVFALQTGYAFRIVNAENLVGATVGISLTREIGPVFAALMVVARAGSAMAAELGTMQVTEQVDALKTMAVSPIQYLVVPRVIAGTLAVPLLAALFSYVGIMGAYFVATQLLGINGGYFMNRLTYFVDPPDYLGGLLKAMIFGCVLSLISCYKGYHTRGGAAGVGQATTEAVVASSVTILVLDYFLTAWILEFFPKF